MKNPILVTSLSLLFINAGAQQTVSLVEDSSHLSDGLEYGYSIQNENSKEVKGEEYERFVISLYVRNSGDCLRLIPFSGRSGSMAVSSNKGYRLAEFSCLNANGKRLTAKKGNVHAPILHSEVRIPDASEKEKFRIINAQLGYAIQGGETVQENIIVLVPKGERPKIKCQVLHLPKY